MCRKLLTRHYTTVFTVSNFLNEVDRALSAYASFNISIPLLQLDWIYQLYFSEYKEKIKEKLRIENIHLYIHVL